MVISGFLWLPETVHGYQWFLWLSWLSVVFYGYQWFSMVTRDCAWLPVVFMVIMVISGFLWLSVVFYGYQRLCMHGYQWFLFLSWLSVVFYGYHWFSIVTGDRAWLSKIVDVVGVFMVISGKKFPTYNKGIQRSS